MIIKQRDGGSCGLCIEAHRVLENGRRGAEGVNAHVFRASRASRLIAVTPEDDFVSQRLLHGRIGDAVALWDAQIT